MPNGFAGAASRKYLGDVSRAHRNALNANSQSQAQMPPNSPQGPRPRQLPFEIDDANVGRHISGIGTSSNIVADTREYNEIATKVREADEKIGRCIYSVCSEIENMCRTMFIMPAAVPRCLNISGNIKTSLSDFGSVTEDSISEILRFARDIDNIGN